MGLSSNQARFLSLTSRQVDLEHRIQQICQRRLRLSSELENVATSYNNSLSNRKMFTPNLAGINALSMDGLKKLGYTVINAVTKTEAAKSMKPIAQMSESAAIAAGYVTIHNVSELISNLNGGAATAGKTYVLQGDIDLSSLGTQANSIIQNGFQGTFDGNGYTISNMNINTNGVSGVDNVGFFSQIAGGAVVKNVAIESSNIIASKSGNVGILAGANNSGGIIQNCYTTGTVAGGTDDTTRSQTYAAVGGLVGRNIGGMDSCYSTATVAGDFAVGGLTGINGNTITNCFSMGDVTANDRYVGGLVGANWGTANVSTSYATGNVTGYVSIGGFIGDLNATSGTSHITDCYSTGTVTADQSVGGFVGGAINNNIVTGCYTTGQVIATGGGAEGGFLGLNQAAQTYGASNFYQNNESGDNSGATKGIPSTGWNANWDTSTTPPTLKNTVLQGSIPSAKLEEGLRNGVYSLAREADEFTQDPFSINGDQYQEVDWRTTPEIYDELYKGDDVAAENKYDKTISEINAQDKKLQLEQTTIEVEYKAVASEKEAVKKILDTNATASFKYFS